MSLVLDCSVTLSWYFEDERTAASLAVLQHVVEQGGVTPSLWRFEVANGLQVAIRRKRVDAAYRAASLVDLAALPIEIDADSDRHVWTATVQLAEQHGLTVYDAAYLELAQRRRLPLASLDRALRQVPVRGLPHEPAEWSSNRSGLAAEERLGSGHKEPAASSSNCYSGIIRKCTFSSVRL